MPVTTPNQQYLDAMTEQQLLETALEILAWHGYLTHHEHDSRHGSAGVPDILAVRDAKGNRPPDSLWVECKTMRGKVTADQGRWLAALEAAGHDCHVLRPSDLPAFTERLKRGRP